MALLVRWIINTLALFLVVTIVPGYHHRGWVSLIIAAAVLGLLNAVVKPVLYVITLPITVITLGLFLLVLNVAMLKLTDWLVPGFGVDGCLPAILGVMLLSIVSFLTNGTGRKSSEG